MNTEEKFIFVTYTPLIYRHTTDMAGNLSSCVFVDEAVSYINMKRLYAWSKEGFHTFVKAKTRAIATAILLQSPPIGCGERIGATSKGNDYIQKAQDDRQQSR